MRRDAAQERYYTCALENLTVLGIPAPVNNPELAGAVLEAMAVEGYNSVTPAYFESALKGKYARDNESAEMLELVLDNKTYDIAQVYNWGTINSSFFNLGAKNNTNFASMWASIESKVETEMQKSLEMMK